MKTRHMLTVWLLWALAIAAPAQAFDTGGHHDVTVNAMLDEGFNQDAADIAAVNNWWVDMYTQADKNPFSGYGGFLNRLVTPVVKAENWKASWIRSAVSLHFDSNANVDGDGGDPKHLEDGVGIEREWDRLRRNTYNAVVKAKAENRPEDILTAIGIGLHALQDFYAHSNWVEPTAQSAPLFAGPGWKEKGFGTNPTWFDVPGDLRRSPIVATTAGPRKHENWDSPITGESPMKALNRDQPSRPLYDEAFVTAYFASRQWVETVQGWVNDPALWARTQHIVATRSALNPDVEAAYGLSTYAGRWDGGGGPVGSGGTHGKAGDLLSLRKALVDYFGHLWSNGPSRYRTRFEALIDGFGHDLSPGEQPPAGATEPASSRPMQEQTRFLKLTIDHIIGIDLGDLVRPGDMYANVGIRGQTFTSWVVNGSDNFSFPFPYAPFTVIRAVPTAATFHPPVRSMQIRVHTGSNLGAGTDDDVYLRISPTKRFLLDKGLYDDFERSDTDWYSVPIDSAVKAGLTIDDIKQVTIEKSSDGVAGGWRLGGIRLKVNDQDFYANDNINQWLEDNHRSWTTTSGFVRDHRTKADVPYWIQLRESDLYDPDDDGDLNPYDARELTSGAYPPGPGDFYREAEGGAKYSGRRTLSNGDKARIRYRIHTINVVPPRPLLSINPNVEPVIAVAPDPVPIPTPTAVPTPTPAPTGKPDLVITAMNDRDITVKNQGAVAAGTFRVEVTGYPFQIVESLAPGQSTTKTYNADTSCVGGGQHGVVDSTGKVDESNEANNVFNAPTFPCFL